MPVFGQKEMKVKTASKLFIGLALFQSILLTVLIIGSLWIVFSLFNNAMADNLDQMLKRQDITELNTGQFICDTKVFVEHKEQLFLRNETISVIKASPTRFTMMVNTGEVYTSSGELTFNGIDYPFSNRNNIEHIRIMAQNEIYYILKTTRNNKRYLYEATCSIHPQTFE